MITLNVNGRNLRTEPDPGEPLLWTLRDRLNMTGTKFGCGAGLCGACTVLVDGVATRSCTVPAEGLDGARITTVESTDDADVIRVRNAWVDLQVPQCGYCQPGFVMAVSGELKANPRVSAEAVVAAVSNLCRCGTHGRILQAVRTLVEGV